MVTEASSSSASSPPDARPVSHLIIFIPPCLHPHPAGLAAMLTVPLNHAEESQVSLTRSGFTFSATSISQSDCFWENITLLESSRPGGQGSHKLNSSSNSIKYYDRDAMLLLQSLIRYGIIFPVVRQIIRYFLLAHRFQWSPFRLTSLLHQPHSLSLFFRVCCGFSASFRFCFCFCFPGRFSFCFSL